MLQLAIAAAAGATAATVAVRRTSTHVPKKITVVYFAVRARAEPARMILEYGKIPYCDESPGVHFRVNGGWKEAKHLTPNGQLPLLIVDGETISQSGTISRYCAGLVPGLVPADAVKAAQCDAIYETANELMSVNPIVNVFKDDVFAAKKKEYFEETLPNRLKCLAKQLGDGPFFLGAQPHYCDFGCYHVLSNTVLLDPSALDAFPNVVRFMERFESLPGVSEYLAMRPKPTDIGTKPMLSPPAVGSRPSPAEAAKSQ